MVGRTVARTCLSFLVAGRWRGDVTPGCDTTPRAEAAPEPVPGAGRVRRLALGLARSSRRSMRPTLHAGDRLLVRYRATPRPGDLVVVARLPDGLVAVKRADAATPAGWWVERDNPAEGVDSWLVGAVAGRRPGGGRVVLAAAGPRARRLRVSAGRGPSRTRPARRRGADSGHPRRQPSAAIALRPLGRDQTHRSVMTRM